MADVTKAPESTGKASAREKRPEPGEQLGDAVAFPQHDRSMMTAQQVLHLQRAVGNQAVRHLMAKRTTPATVIGSESETESYDTSTEEGESTFVMGESLPTHEDHAPTQRIQRVTATVKGKSVGKTSLRNRAGKVVGKAKKGIDLEVDNSSTVALPGVSKLYYLVTDASQAFPGDGAPLTELFVEASAVSVQGGELEDDEGEGEEEAAPEESADELATLEVELFNGHKFTLNASGAQLSGEIEEEFSVDTFDAVEFSVDFPIPGAPGIYIEAGIAITPKLGLTLGGTYDISKTPTETSFNFSGSATAEASLGLEAHAGVGAGVANIVGVSAGLFAEANIGAKLEGKLEGTVKRDARKTWTSSTLKLSLAGEAAIMAKVGAYLKAKLLMLNATKKFPIKEKELAKWEFEREASVTKAGVQLSDFKPKLSDITIGTPELESGEVIPDTTPLLRGSGRSDS